MTKEICAGDDVWVKAVVGHTAQGYADIRVVSGEPNEGSVQSVPLDQIRAHNSDSAEPVAWLTPYFENDPSGKLVPIIVSAETTTTIPEEYKPLYLASPPAKEISKAGGDVLSERKRQVEAEGWTPEHDDQHEDGEMAGAAACYARHDVSYPLVKFTPAPQGAVADAAREAAKQFGLESSLYKAMKIRSARRLEEHGPMPPQTWPWAKEWWKPKDRRQNLVRAAALLIAEIERLDRTALTNRTPDDEVGNG